MDQKIITIKVKTDVSKDKVCGWKNDILYIETKAPRKNGKANLAIIKILSKYFDLPITSFKICSGHQQSKKTVLISKKEDKK